MVLHLSKKNKYNYKKTYKKLEERKILSQLNKKPNTVYGRLQDMEIKPEDITFDNLITDKNYRISASKIRVTTHAKQQAYIRMGIQSVTEIQKLSARAKRNGILVNSLDDHNYEKYKLSKEHYEWLIDKSGCRGYTNQNTNIFFYKSYFYVFCGPKFHTLKTIIYPGLPIEDTKPASNDDIVDEFFNSITDNPFHNINLKKNCKVRRTKGVIEYESQQQ